MENKNIEWGKEIVQVGSDVAGLAKDVGIPGVGLVARFIQHFYDTQLQKRFEKFISDAEIDEELLSKISKSETYSNCFYGILETVRQTHSRIGLIALALIYKERWNDETYLIAAMQAFSQVSDATIDAFISLYESIPEDDNHLILKIQNGDEGHFHNFYNEAVELIRRNFFVMSSGASMYANGPVQGMKWDHTDSYYAYCKSAKILV
ncbi:hypothetical protein [Candidatus Symbiopectobacterium sp. NZEC151]|uniref:hypothetical protein n=3 Tax=unclassified Symbiopectobacterium TaxID=2794573 RepID=UPI00222708BD|nr:hypothetical protein [Candidatus Symbiopectobacterium sp. NZEC151]MCW2473251.1 hypothetical protein [Candidatus Symbiopectobacterium sp. NZEC151]